MPFIIDLFEQFAFRNKKYKFYFILQTTFIKSTYISNNIEVIKTTNELKGNFSIKYWYNISLPIILRKVKATLLINTDGMNSITSAIPQLLILPEVNFINKKLINQIQKKLIQLFTFSEKQKKFVIENFSIHSDLVYSISISANEIYKPLALEYQQEIKERYTDQKEYFFSRINIYKDNNIINLLKAFSIFKKWQKSNMKLVIVGDLFGDINEWNKIIETYKYKEDVIIINELATEEIAKLTAAAYCAIYINESDDIALPILEAMQCDVPIIGINNDKIKEIGGDAVLYSNSLNIEDIAGQMQNIYKNENLRSKQILLGKNVIKQFNWDKSLNDLSQLFVLKTGF